MSTKSGTPANLRADPMTYRVESAPSLTAQRIYLAQTAGDLTAEELKEQAAAAQIDLSGASSKEQMVAAVTSQVRGEQVNPSPEG